MGKVPPEIRENIATNIKACRTKKYPGRGGEKRCAEAFGVLPQQWSPWERGKRTPDELRLSQIAEFFGVTVEYLQQRNSESTATSTAENTIIVPPENSTACPFLRTPQAGQPTARNVKNLCWLAETLLGIRGDGEICIKLHQDDAAAFMEFYVNNHSDFHASQKKDLS